MTRKDKIIDEDPGIITENKTMKSIEDFTSNKRLKMDVKAFIVEKSRGTFS